jgi:hypothetical protein
MRDLETVSGSLPTIGWGHRHQSLLMVYSMLVRDTRMYIELDLCSNTAFRIPTLLALYYHLALASSILCNYTLVLLHPPTTSLSSS